MKVHQAFFTSPLFARAIPYLELVITSFFLFQITEVHAAQSHCLDAYDWHIRGMSESDVQRLRPGHYTREQLREAKEMRAGRGTQALAGFGGALVELNLLPLTVLASPWIVKGQLKIRQYRKMRDLIRAAVSDEGPQSAVVRSFVSKIRKFYRSTRVLRDLNRDEFLTPEGLVVILRFANANLLLCAPSREDRIVHGPSPDAYRLFPHLLKPMTPKRFIRKFPLILESYIMLLRNHQNDENERRAFERELANSVVGITSRTDLIEEGDACSICLEEFSSTEDQTIVSFPCDRDGKDVRNYHSFHESCIRGSLRHSNKCPLCRNSLRLE